VALVEPEFLEIPRAEATGCRRLLYRLESGPMVIMPTRMQFCLHAK
jgi:hypothetical protein